MNSSHTRALDFGKTLLSRDAVFYRTLSCILSFSENKFNVSAVCFSKYISLLQSIINLFEMFRNEN